MTTEVGEFDVTAMVKQSRLLLMVKEGGPRTKRRIMRVLRRWQFIDLFVYELIYSKMLTVAQPDKEIVIKELTETNDSLMAAVAGFRFYGHSQDDLVRFLRAGERCYVAECEGQPVCCYWCAREEYYDHLLRRRFRFARGEEYLLGGYTLPAFRGMGILPHLIKVSSEERAWNNWALKATAFVRASNEASQRSCEKLGFMRTGRVGFIECLGIRWSFLVGRDALPETAKRNFISLSRGK